MTTHTLLQTALDALEEIVDWRTTGLGRPPEQTAMDAITALRAALAQPAAEPDMRHPEIQALIGSRARAQIALQLVEQLIEDPHFETTALDMEHWDALHDRLKEKLTATPPAIGGNLDSAFDAPGDMVMVPREPTPEMNTCGSAALYRVSGKDIDATGREMAVVYRAMIRVAPK